MTNQSEVEEILENSNRIFLRQNYHHINHSTRLLKHTKQIGYHIPIFLTIIIHLPLDFFQLISCSNLTNIG